MRLHHVSVVCFVLPCVVQGWTGLTLASNHPWTGRHGSFGSTVWASVERSSCVVLKEASAQHGVKLDASIPSSVKASGRSGGTVDAERWNRTEAATRAFTYDPPLTPLDILFEDEHLIVVNKPSGLLSVPGKYEKDCLVRRVAAVRDLPRVDKMIVHRLDMATSGCVVFAKSDEALVSLNAMFRERRVRKRYIAMLYGHVGADSGEVALALRMDKENVPLQMLSSGWESWGRRWGRECRANSAADSAHFFSVPAAALCGHPELGTRSLSLFKVTGRYFATASGETFTRAAAPADAAAVGDTAVAAPTSVPAYPVTRVELTPHTGKRHQLRIHMQEGLGHPILGDQLYCHRRGLELSPDRCMLHAESLGFDHPVTEGQEVYVEAQCPY